MKKKKIILSFDYELLFGDCSGTVQKTLIEPTNQLLDAMDSVGFKGNFFVDWQMLKYLKEEGNVRTDSDYAFIESQLKDIIRRGHRIELHIHPHWVDAKYNGDGTWDFSDFKHYCLNSFTEEEIVGLFEEGTELLTNIAREVDPFYEIVAFRAGGWAIQPFQLLRPAFEKVGIKIDSSTMSGVKIITDYSSCDFINIPVSSKGYYNFADEVEKEDSEGKFIEVPISSVKLPFMSRVIGRLLRYFSSPAYPMTDGTHTRSNDNPDRWFVPTKRAVCTFSAYHPVDGVLRLVNSDSDMLCYIDHPKDYSKYTVKGIRMISKYANSLLYKDL